MAYDLPKFRFVRVMHEGIPVSKKNLDACIEFYTKVLGLTRVDRPRALDELGTGAWFENEDRSIQFHLIGNDEDFKPGPDAKIAPAGRHTALMISDLGKFRERMRAVGVHFDEVGGLVGRPQLFIKDPEGHTWEFQSSPPSSN